MKEAEPDEALFWRDVEEACNAVWAAAEPQRAAVVEARCAGRPRLRQEVEALVAADAQAGAFLEPRRLECASFAETDSRLGQTLSHYRILSEISRGGMGIVYQALDLDLGREVALKVLPPALVADRERRRRFVQEARAAARLEHPHVAGIHEIGEASGTTFIAMELIRGETLAAVLDRERLRPGRVLALALEVAEGLAHAHAHGIVHRDLKPGNIMLSHDGHVRIIDFSLAKLTQPDGPPGRGDAATDTGRVVGTPAYMSPEQARGAEVDRRSDIFSFGIVLFEMLAGVQPFRGESDVETLHAILDAPAPPVPGVPAELQRLLQRCLAKAVSERQQSMQDVILDLRAAQACVERPAAPAERGGRRRRVLLRCLALCAAAAVVLGLAAREPHAGQRARSVAVLPFAAESPELQYVADGLTEALINQLSQVPALHVIARTTAFQRRGRPADAAAVGRELGVAQVVTGRLARANDVTSLQVDLIESHGGMQLWGRQYRLTPTELADCERALAATLATELGLPGSLPDSAPAGRDPQAHELYLQGRFFWNKRTGEGLRRGMELFRAALARDPGYAEAWSGLADAWALLPEYGGASESEAFPQARQAAEKALQLDGGLAEAHTSLAFARFWGDRAWPQAEQEFQRALQLNPGYATAHHWYGNALLAMGRTSEGVAQLEQAQRSDPLSLVVGTELGAALYLARRYHEAAARLDRTLELDERFSSAHSWSGDVALAANRIGEARRHFERARALSGRPMAKLAKLGLTELRGGNAALARHYLQRLDALDPGHDVAYDRAILLAGLGEREAALGALEQAFVECSTDLAFIGLDPLFDPLRREARFTEFVRRLGRSGPSAASPWPSPAGRLWASAREVR